MDELVTKENIQEILYLYFIGLHRSADLCMELAKSNAEEVYERYLYVREIEKKNKLNKRILDVLNIPVIEI